ncbi:thiol peroxidase [Streptococcus danieliae]|uniref:Thiol peroxidase n=1 Tax=Streptococcus danieliae TaxID=747656 RepID=A0A7Z0RQU4_9STRE|nr:thiol peroxidase [Streptococcus danieliae]MBF0717380.1 thiol peroxidase [Streptococcus danieliae]MVX58982.1 thiol peroxidase [Streptococcus danieliae]NYS49310.1 thiol peroxidase [Streptococcus danieliae]
MPQFLGQEVHLIGNRLQIGDLAPDFTLLNKDLEKVSLSDFPGKKKVLSIVPSIDTGVCSTQTRQFNANLAGREDTVIMTISIDTPFAQARWCGVEGLDKAIMLSDYFDNSFGKAYGLLMEEWHILSRSVLILDETNTVRYVEYLEDVHSEPDYGTAIQALDEL